MTENEKIAQEYITDFQKRLGESSIGKRYVYDEDINCIIDKDLIGKEVSYIIYDNDFNTLDSVTNLLNIKEDQITFLSNALRDIQEGKYIPATIAKKAEEFNRMSIESFSNKLLERLEKEKDCTVKQDRKLVETIDLDIVKSIINELKGE